MPDGNPDPITDWIKKLAESATRIRLAPGVIGKSTYINVGTVVLWAIVLWRLSPTEFIFDGILIGCAVLATLWGQRQCRLMREFAIANPSLALMEGADITEYKKFEAEAKSIKNVGKSPLTTDPNKPVISAIPVSEEPEQDG